MMIAPKEMNPMRAFATATALTLSLMLTACGDERPQNRGLDSVHQPVVQRTDYIFDLATSGNRLAPGEITRLRGWFDSLHLRYGDKVAVDAGDGVGVTAAANEIASVAAARGLAIESHAPITQGAVAPGSIRVVMSRTTASVPGCPEFRESALAKFNSTTAPNFGCAVNSSLAAMIANPEDLVQGRNTDDHTVNQVNTSAIATYYEKVSQKAGEVKSEGTGK
jgi:pilus assembly protein CpaD